MKQSRDRARRIVSGVCALLLTCAPALALRATAESSYSDATTQAYEAEIDRLREEQESWSRQLDYIKNSQASAEEKAEYLQKQIALTDEKIKVTQELINSLNGGIAEKQTQISVETENIDRTYRNFLNQMRISYEQQDGSVLAVLLDSDGLADLLSRVERLSSMLDYDKRLKAKYEQAKDNLEDAKLSLETTLAKQQQYSAELAADIAQNEQLLKETEDTILNLGQNEQYARTMLANRIAEQEKLDAELDEYIQEMIRKSEEQYDGGLLSWPLPKENYVGTCKYGYGILVAYGVEQVRFHNGVDLRAFEGTDIYAAAPGTVQISTYNSDYGYYILVDHGGGISTLYAHLSRLDVTVGQKVARGERIGLSGNTGYSFGAHLHFEVRVEGLRVDPIYSNVLDIPSQFYWLPDA